MPQAHLCSVQDNTGYMLCKLFKSSNSQLVYSVLLVKCQHINTIHQKHPRFKNVLTSSSICKMLPLKHPWRNPCQSSHLQTEGGIFQETDALFNCLKMKRWATTGTPINPSPESCVCLKMWYQYNIYVYTYIYILYMHYIYPNFCL